MRLRPVRVPASYEHPRAARILLGAAAVTYVGDEVTAVALALALYASGAGGAAVAALFIVKMLPVVLLAPVAGWMTDRYRPERLLAVSAAVAGLVVAGTAFTDSVPLWLVGTALISATTALSQPCLMVLLPRAAGRDQGRRLLSWAAIASRSSAATGALLAGVLVHVGGLQLALLVDAGSYLVVVLAVRYSRLPATVHEPVAPREPGEPRPALAGLHLIATDPVLRVVLAVLLTAISFVGISYVAVFFLAQDVLQAGPRGATLVVGAYGAGMTVGCYVAGRLPLRLLAVTAVRAPVVVGLAFLAPVLVQTLSVAVAGFAVAGLCMGGALTALRGLVLERVPPALLGRVWAAEMALGVSGELLALLAAGVVISTAGPVAAIALCGAGALTAGLCGVVALRPGALAVATLPVPPVRLPEPRAAADAAPVPSKTAGPA